MSRSNLNDRFKLDKFKMSKRMYNIGDVKHYYLRKYRQWSEELGIKTSSKSRKKINYFIKYYLYIVNELTELEIKDKTTVFFCYDGVVYDDINKAHEIFAYVSLKYHIFFPIIHPPKDWTGKWIFKHKFSPFFFKVYYNEVPDIYIDDFKLKSIPIYEKCYLNLKSYSSWTPSD